MPLILADLLAIFILILFVTLLVCLVRDCWYRYYHGENAGIGSFLLSFIFLIVFILCISSSNFANNYWTINITGQKLFSSTEEAKVTNFDFLYKKIPQWREGVNGTFIPIRDDKIQYGTNFSEIFVQEVQITGSCPLHASLRCYDYWKKRKNFHSKPIAMDSFIRHNLTFPEYFAPHPFDGHSSQSYLQHLVFPIPLHPFAPKNINVQLMKEYGALLVSGFRTTPEFRKNDGKIQYGDSDLFSYNGLNLTYDRDEFNAMVLIGIRIVGIVSGLERKFFLLQNWWRTKQLVEVSEEYLKQSGAVMWGTKEDVPEHVEYKKFSGGIMEMSVDGKEYSFAGIQEY